MAYPQTNTALPEESLDTASTLPAFLTVELIKQSGGTVQQTDLNYNRGGDSPTNTPDETASRM